jgi:hypothetical protein
VAGQQPNEPSDVYRADGSRVPRWRTTPGTVPAGVRSLLPALLRGSTAGPLLTASALAVAVAAVVTARAAEAARQVVAELAREVVGTRPPDAWFDVSVTRIEVRWRC